MTRYIGNGPYCYANSTAMLLATVGVRADPSLIEVLTGVGLGAFWLDGPKRLICSNPATPPDVGISHALNLLGFEFVEQADAEDSPPSLKALSEILADSPAVLGPVDLGYLSYNPGHEHCYGLDHYILALGVEGASVRIHDPDGFPHVTLPFESLLKAWKAEQIAYQRDSWRYWTAPKRLNTPTEQALFERAVELFKSCYGKSVTFSEEYHWPINKEAILALSDYIGGEEVSEGTENQMKHFLFKISARRSLDYAVYFADHVPVLSDLKNQQSELFGRCHTLTVDRQWPDLSAALSELADIEDEFRTTLLAY